MFEPNFQKTDLESLNPSYFFFCLGLLSWPALISDPMSELTSYCRIRSNNAGSAKEQISTLARISVGGRVTLRSKGSGVFSFLFPDDKSLCSFDEMGRGGWKRGESVSLEVDVDDFCSVSCLYFYIWRNVLRNPRVTRISLATRASLRRYCTMTA